MPNLLYNLTRIIDASAVFTVRVFRHSLDASPMIRSAYPFWCRGNYWSVLTDEKTKHPEIFIMAAPTRRKGNQSIIFRRCWRCITEWFEIPRAFYKNPFKLCLNLQTFLWPAKKTKQSHSNSLQTASSVNFVTVKRKNPCRGIYPVLQTIPSHLKD